MRKWLRVASVAVVPAMLLLGGCTVSPPTQPTQYSRLVIDTYMPDPGMSFTPNIVVSLYGATGTAGAPIVSGTYLTAPNPDPSVGSGYTRLDYTGGLDAGTYYIKVTGNAPADYGAYAIRILTTLPSPAYSAPVDYFAVVNNPDSYEADDTVSGGISTKPAAIAVGDRLNRYIEQTVGDTDWFVLTLP